MINDFKEYLKADEIIDFYNLDVKNKAKELKSKNNLNSAKNCFNFVKDEIKHTGDYGCELTTLKASEVLKLGYGWCYAKSHLLCALLRANGIPCGFDYQRLSINDNGEPYSLHGLNTIYLDDYGWFRVDARGDNKNLKTKFIAGEDCYAIKLNPKFEEYNLDLNLTTPYKKVVEALKNNPKSDSLRMNFPDV